MSFLRTTGLAVGYNRRAVLSGIDLELRTSSVTCLLGRNGAGKTTILKTIAGAVAAVEGIVELDGALLRGALYRRARRGVVLVADDTAVLRTLTARDNLRLGAGGVEAGVELFPELAGHLDRTAGLLSGGQQKMIALARGLASSPRVLLVDELSLGLAPQIIDRLMGALRHAADAGVAVLVVEQYPHVALSASDYGYVVGGGHIAFHGPSTALAADIGRIEDAYFSAPNPTASTIPNAEKTGGTSI